MADIKQESSKRVLHFDILRVLAIFLVAFNHTGMRGYMLFSESRGSIFYFPYMIVSVLCKIAVPVFFMISGALLLPKQESFKQLFRKRILRMVAVLIIASVPYYIWLQPSDSIGVLHFFSFIYSSCASTFMWYLYSYIGLLLLLPFLRSMVRGMEKKDFIYLLAGHLVLVGAIPCLEFCLSGGTITLNESFSSVIFVTQNVFFAIMGYYFEHVFDKKIDRKIIGVLLAGSAVALAATCAMTHYQTIKIALNSPEQAERFFECFIVVPTITVFLLIKHVSLKINGSVVQKVMSILGSSVFGVYLIEKLARAVTDGVYIVLSPFLGSFVAAIVWCVATCCFSFAVITGLKHIPFVKTLVNAFI